ncbi:hypothetical protein CAEBREN_22108 [Caenorhabditis brenneri]|uniref:Uncharacterized protein n=1 Tax=Caenorhabditis brenneri TaxID=135651 RepID=G0PLP2_CAEBE|nr:hypothetical protein CAEBREN_22108 [Caenorhabditis brenneri]
MRSFLAAIIAIERVIASFIPLHFYSYRKRISNIPIIAFVVSTGLACDVVLFGICGMKLPLDPGCMSINCAIPSGYQNYTFITRMFYSSINILFSGILCVKLLSMSLQRTCVPVDLRKPNLLSLTDGLSTLSFDLIPSLLSSYGIIDSKSLGPVVGVLRQIGRGVEAAVMVKLMKKTTTVQPSKTEE